MLGYPIRMLCFVISVFRVDQKYKKYITIAGLLLVLGYISLLAFIYVAFNTYDVKADGAKQSTNAVVPIERLPSKMHALLRHSSGLNLK